MGGARCRTNGCGWGRVRSGRGIDAGQVDPRELTEVYLAAIESHPHAPAIYARVTQERARAEASAAADRARTGLRRGPLDGVPVSWKDLFDSAGVATEAGSALLRDRVPDRDAAVLASATRAGMVCLGKTHMTELAFSGLGLNPSTATPPNINDPEHAPGGSSSGQRPPVAFGLAAAAIGSDTGGSVRVPAAWNDLAGLKTSFGCVPTGGGAALPALRHGRPDHPDGGGCGAVALGPRRDAGAGPRGGGGARPALSRARHLRPWRDARRTGRRLRRSGRGIAEAGAMVETAAVPATDAALRLAPLVFAPEAYGVWGATIEARPEAMFAPIRERFRSGAAVSAADYVDAWRQIDGHRAAYAAATAAFDAVLLPTVPILPPDVEALLADPALFAAENVLTLRNTRIGNMLGLAALTVPTEHPSCGLMAMVRPGTTGGCFGSGWRSRRRSPPDRSGLGFCENSGLEGVGG